MSGSLGSAYIDVVARTGQFRSKLAADLKAVLESSRTTTKLQMDDFDRLVASATAAGKRIIAAETEAYKIVEAASRAATNAQIAANKEALASWREKTKEIAAAESEAYRIAEAASKAATRAQEDDIDRLVASAAAGARRIAAAETEAYKVAETASKAATRAIEDDVDRQVASAAAGARRLAAAWDEAYAEVARRAAKTAAEQAAAAKFAAAEAERAAASTKASFGGQFLSGLTKSFKSLPADIGNSIGKSVSSIPKDIFGAVATSAKFATVGVLGLGAAMVGIGLVNAAKQQAAVVGFTALASQISATTDATTGLNVATQGLTQAQSKAIGQDFENRLITLANNSALSQAALQDTTQALLALGFNGDQSVGIIRDIGNALAASGKTGGQLNEDLKGIVVAFSQIKGSGRLLAQDLNQITTRIPSAGRIQVYTQLGKALKLAGANAKDGTPAFKAMTTEVQKLAKEGKIGSEVAIASITKALELVPGAAADAITGLDALGRQNLTLTGRFEALKDNVRSALAKAFLLPGEAGGPGGGKSLSDRLADQIGLLIPQITDAIAKIGPPLSKFVEQFTGVLIKFLPPLVSLIGSVFGGLGSALDSINSNLDGVTSGFSKFKDVLDKVNIGPALLEVFKAIGDAIPPIIALVGGIVVEWTPLISIISSVARILIAVLTPVIEGAAQAFAGIGLALTPIADALRPVADAIQAAFGNEIVQQILTIVGQVAALTAVFLSVGGAIGAVTVAVTALLPILAVLAAELIAIIGIPELIALALAGLVIGFIKAWKASETFRDVVVEALKFVAHAVVAPIQLILIVLQKFLDALATVAHAMSSLPGIPDVSGPIRSAADAIGGLNDDINNAIGSMDGLKSVGVTTAAELAKNFTTDQIKNFNDTLGLTGAQALSSKADLVELGSAIAALPDEKQIKIFVTIGTQNTDFLKSKGIPLTGLEDASGFSTAGINAAASAAKAADAAAKSTADQLLANLPKGGGGGGGASGGAAKSAAKSAAANIKATFLQALKDILASLDSDFKKTLVGGTRKQIDTALDTLSKKIASVFKAGKQKRPSGLLDDIAADNVKLKNLSVVRAKIADKLKAATARFDEVKSAIQSFASVSGIDLDALGLSATKATDKLVDLSRLRIILPGQDSLNTLVGGSAAVAAGSVKFAQALADKLQAIKDFQANIKKLIAENLNPTTVDQIISAGPEAGGALAASLASASAATIASINTSQTAIDAAATTLANVAVDSLFRSGKSVVDGLIAGLKEKDGELKAAMRGLADSLVSEIKKALKSHSPSRVTHAIGRDIGAGLHLGMASKAADVTAAARNMAAAAVPPNLNRLAHADASSQLAALGLPTMSGRQAVSTSTATNSKTYNAPITQHFHQSGHDPNAVAKALAKAVGGLR